MDYTTADDGTARLAIDDQRPAKSAPFPSVGLTRELPNSSPPFMSWQLFVLGPVAVPFQAHGNQDTACLSAMVAMVDHVLVPIQLRVERDEGVRIICVTIASCNDNRRGRVLTDGCHHLKHTTCGAVAVHPGIQFHSV